MNVRTEAGWTFLVTPDLIRGPFFNGPNKPTGKWIPDQVRNDVGCKWIPDQVRNDVGCK